MSWANAYQSNGNTGNEENAADVFATLMVLKMKDAFSDRALTNVARGFGNPDIGWVYRVGKRRECRQRAPSPQRQRSTSWPFASSIIFSSITAGPLRAPFTPPRRM